MKTDLLYKFILLLIASSLFCLLPGVAFSQDSAQLPPAEKAAIESLVQVMDRLHQPPGGQAWPGYDLSEKPIIVRMGDNHLFAFNLENRNPAWQPLQVGEHTVLFSAQDPWGLEKVQMQPNFNIDGQHAFVFYMDLEQQGPPFLSFLILVHEVFHQYQFTHFVMQDRGLQPYQDHLNGDNLALMQLEEILLHNFVVAPQQDKLERLKDFQAVSQLRRSMLKPTSLFWEHNQQRMEGLADYVSFRAFAGKPILKDFDEQRHLAIILRMAMEDDNVSDRAIKRRHYGVGAALGYALDFLNVPHWKEQVEEGANLADLVDAALPLSAQEVTQRATLAMAVQHYETMLTTVSSKIEQYAQEVDTALKQYDQTDGVAVALYHPPTEGISGGGTQGHMYYLADGTILSTHNSSVNASHDHNWNLELIKAPCVVQRFGAREFKVDRDAEWMIDNQPYRLQELLALHQDKPFQSIQCKGGFGSFSSTHHRGVLKVVDGKILIVY